MATNVRFLEQAGSTRSMAIGAVGVSSVAGFLVHVAAIGAVLPWLGVRGVLHLPALDVADRWPWACGVIAATVSSVGVATRRWLWARAVGPARTMWAAAGASLRTPGSVASLLLGSAGVTAAYAWALAASVQAVGGGVGPLRRFTTYWLPVLPGWLAFRWLRANGGL
jgi:hypothetical protein